MMYKNILAAILLLLFAGCSKSSGKGEARVIINLNNTGSRSTRAPSNVRSLTLFVTAPDISARTYSFSTGVDRMTVSLPPGKSRIFSLYAFDPTGEVVYYGQISADLQPGKTNLTINMLLSPLPQTLAFRDEDVDEDRLSGTVYIVNAPDETYASEYRLYWGSTATEKLPGAPMIASFTSSNSTHTHLFSADTPVPSGANYLLAFSVNSLQETPLPRAVELRDLVLRLAADINSGATGSYPSYLATANGYLYFAADNGIDGTEPYEYDGVNPPVRITAASEINASGNSTPMNFAAYNNKVYFSAIDIVDSSLWEWDRSLSSITNVGVSLGGGVPGGAYPGNFVQWNNKLYFTGFWSDYDCYIHDFDSSTTTWTRHTSTSMGLAQNPIVLYNSNLYYAADITGSGYGNELAYHDGIFDSAQYPLADLTSTADINPGTGSSSPTNLTVYNNKLFFSANDGVDNIELWVYNGTSASNVADLNPSGSSNPSFLTLHQNRLYFTADSGVSGAKIYVYDDATRVVSELVDIDPGGTNLYISDLTSYGDLIVFGVGNDGSDQIWVYDSTLPVSVSEPNMNPHRVATGYTNTSNLTVYNDRLYFTWNDPISGYELWVMYYK